jgi:hypothetical protein
MANDLSAACGREHTFVVMAYGDSPFLPECLDALLRQSVPSAICIATSTPSDYLRHQARRIGAPLYVTESGRGIAHDWNFALRQAKTKYVTLAHQDDLYAPDYTKKCLDKIQRFPNALICFTDYTELVGNLERRVNLLLTVKRCMLHFFMPFQRVKTRFWKSRLLSLGCPIAAPSVLYHLDNLGDFQFSPEFSVNMDWDAWSRIALLRGDFIFVPEKLMQHRIHPDSATTQGIAARRRQEEDARIFRRFWPSPIARLLLQCYALSYRSNG